MCKCLATQVACCCCSCAMSMLISVAFVVLIALAIATVAVYFGVFQVDSDNPVQKIVDEVEKHVGTSDNLLNKAG